MIKKTCITPFSSVSIVDSEQVNVGWVLSTPLNIVNIKLEFQNAYLSTPLNIVNIKLEFQNAYHKQKFLPLKRGTVLFSSFREMTSHPCHPPSPNPPLILQFL